MAKITWWLEILWPSPETKVTSENLASLIKGPNLSAAVALKSSQLMLYFPFVIFWISYSFPYVHTSFNKSVFFSGKGPLTKGRFQKPSSRNPSTKGVLPLSEGKILLAVSGAAPPSVDNGQEAPPYLGLSLNFTIFWVASLNKSSLSQRNMFLKLPRLNYQV